LDATRASNVCPQTVDFALYNVSGLAQNEDCLYLNVFTPRLSCTRCFVCIFCVFLFAVVLTNLAAIPSNDLPVVVFVYGGAFIAGSAVQPMYEASNLASAQNVVIVTANYRIGALGMIVIYGLTWILSYRIPCFGIFE